VATTGSTSVVPPPPAGEGRVGVIAGTSGNAVRRSFPPRQTMLLIGGSSKGPGTGSWINGALLDIVIFQRSFPFAAAFALFAPSRLHLPLNNHTADHVLYSPSPRGGGQGGGYCRNGKRVREGQGSIVVSQTTFLGRPRGRSVCSRKMRRGRESSIEKGKGAISH
jgi:hypothetical protein